MKIWLRENKGISLIVLVITIIVMIILAGAIVVSLNNSGIISKANNAVDVTNLAQVRNLATMLWAEAYAGGARTDVDLGTAVVNGLNEVEGLNVNDYIVITTTGGVTVEKANYVYYSALSGAIEDVNNGTIGQNADANKANAVAGVHTNNGSTYVVLFKDTIESASIECTINMTINLGGNVVTFDGTNEIGFNISNGKVTFDGRLAGSTVKFTENSKGLRIVQVVGGSNVVLNGGIYAMTTAPEANVSPAVIAVENGNAEVNNCTLLGNYAQTTKKSSSGVYVLATGRVNITNTKIEVASTTYQSAGVANLGKITISNSNITTKDCVGSSWGIINYSEASLTNCRVEGLSDLTKENGKWTNQSIGIANKESGNVTLNNCYVIGTFYGVLSDGDMRVNGGTYEGYGGGGLTTGVEGKNTYLRNATIRECEMPEGYTSNYSSDFIGMRIGGDSRLVNVKVYVDNCNIYGSKQPIYLGGDYAEENNILYISNSTINLDYTSTGVHIGSDTHKLYIGKGCNFTADNTNRPTSVVVTDEVYIK